MIAILIAVFLLTYLAITLEHPLQVNKSASALIGAGLLWTVYALGIKDAAQTEEALGHTVVETAQIVFFLMGAMTIVEVIDSHNGFEVLTSRINTKSLSLLIWIISLITFFLSAILDNLTTTIVMVSLLKKLLTDKGDRIFLAGMVVIAANAGGAWSPIGDVTTTMLWIGGQITPMKIIESLFLPSLVNLAIPLLIISYLMRNRLVVSPPADPHATQSVTTLTERNIMFYLGLGVLIAVPAFKTMTHLPPFLGILLGLGIVWLVGDLLHKQKTSEDKQRLNLAHALSRIDLSSLVFFIGILLAVSTLEHTHVLSLLAERLNHTVGRQDLIVILIGLFSAVVDNVPLVASAMGMYSLQQYPTDSFLWEFLAYCAGTGGSILIIGSAAGIAAMGIEKIGFFWYARRVGPLALIGYLSGALVYIAIRG